MSLPGLTVRPEVAETVKAVSTVPVAERCRMPRQHRLQPWERCGLCAGQLEFELFGPGEVTA